MELHLNGTEEIKVTNKDNGFKEITVNGLDYKLPDGTIRKVNIVLPNCELNLEEKTIMAYESGIDKSLWTLELEDIGDENNE